MAEYIPESAVKIQKKLEAVLRKSRDPYIDSTMVKEQLDNVGHVRLQFAFTTMEFDTKSGTMVLDKCPLPEDILQALIKLDIDYRAFELPKETYNTMKNELGKTRRVYLSHFVRECHTIFSKWKRSAIYKFSALLLILLHNDHHLCKKTEKNDCITFGIYSPLRGQDTTFYNLKRIVAHAHSKEDSIDSLTPITL